MIRFSWVVFKFVCFLVSYFFLWCIGFCFLGNDVRGVCGCGMWCGLYGDFGKVIYLNFLFDLFEFGFGFRIIWIV